MHACMHANNTPPNRIHAHTQAKRLLMLVSVVQLTQKNCLMDSDAQDVKRWL